MQAEERLASWAQFRGPNGNGFVSTQHPSNWSDEQNVAWSREISGGGWSSPIAKRIVVGVSPAAASAGSSSSECVVSAGQLTIVFD